MGTVDFHAADELNEHRAAARAWVDANADPAWVEEQHRSGCYQSTELHQRLADDGILAAGWPSELGGSDVDPGFARAVFEEVRLAGFHFDGWATTSMVIHTIAEVGTEEQKHAYVGGALRGEVLIALGYSEADAGSDMAAARTTAVPDGDEWIVDGEKMFTSTAQVCSHVFVLARTDPDAPKHAGLSLLMVPTDAPGYSCRPIHTLGGQTTTATHYRAVRVDGAALIGGVNNGWNVVGVALAHERGDGGPSSFEEPFARILTDWAAATVRADGSAVLDDPLVAARIGRIWVDEEVTRLLGHWSGWKAVERGHLGVGRRHPEAVRQRIGPAQQLRRPRRARARRAAPPRRTECPRRWCAGTGLPPGTGEDDLRRQQRDHARRHRPAPSRPTPKPGLSRDGRGPVSASAGGYSWIVLNTIGSPPNSSVLNPASWKRWNRSNHGSNGAGPSNRIVGW